MRIWVCLYIHTFNHIKIQKTSPPSTDYERISSKIQLASVTTPTLSTPNRLFTQKGTAIERDRHNNHVHHLFPPTNKRRHIPVLPTNNIIPADDLVATSPVTALSSVCEPTSRAHAFVAVIPDPWPADKIPRNTIKVRVSPGQEDAAGTLEAGSAGRTEEALPTGGEAAQRGQGMAETGY